MLISKLCYLGLLFTQIRYGLGIGVDPERNKPGKSSLRMPPSYTDLSWDCADALLRKPPTTDYILLFYSPYNPISRQFMNLFITLSHQFTQDGKSVKFGRVDCSGSLMGDNLCHRYNVGVVPSVAYVSQFIIQREHLSTQGTVSRALRWSLSKSIDDIKSLHSTCYKGDLFIYQELYDWASILYSIGRIRRLFDKMSLDNMLQRLLGYFRH